MKKIIQLLLVSLFTISVSAQDLPDSSLVILESIMPHNLNPQETAYSSDAQVLNGLYEGLFTYDPVTLDPVYAIAQGYKLSRDKKRWTFMLRQNAKFSNGEPITAESVKFAWLELLGNPNAPYASLLDIVRGAAEYRNGVGSRDDVGIYVVDDYTISLYLKSPANYLPKVLCHDSFAIIHRNPTVYSGAFVLEEQMDNVIILKKNPYYWDFDNVKLETISFIQSGDAAENAYYYNTGIADWVSTEVDTEKIINKKAFQYNAQFGTSYFFFKQSNKKPDLARAKIKGEAVEFQPWDYQEFRTALLEAWPWEELNRSFISASTFVYPLSGYPTVEGYTSSDKIEATLLMKEARKKYGIAEDQILQLNFEVSEYAFADADKTNIQNALEPLGIYVNFIILPAYQYLSHVPLSNSDLFGYTWIGDFADPLAFLELFHGDSTLNDSGWKNEEYDELLKQAELESAEERYRLLSKAETLLLDSGIVIPYYHPVSSNVIDLDAIGGWSTNAFDIHPLKYLYKKEIHVDIPNVVLR